eukprot:6487848-Amphidinium_carterae.1
MPPRDSSPLTEPRTPKALPHTASYTQLQQHNHCDITLFKPMAECSTQPDETIYILNYSNGTHQRLARRGLLCADGGLQLLL